MLHVWRDKEFPPAGCPLACCTERDKSLTERWAPLRPPSILCSLHPPGDHNFRMPMHFESHGPPQTPRIVPVIAHFPLLPYLCISIIISWLWEVSPMIHSHFTKADNRGGFVFISHSTSHWCCPLAFAKIHQGINYIKHNLRKSIKWFEELNEE